MPQGTRRRWNGGGSVKWKCPPYTQSWTGGGRVKPSGWTVTDGGWRAPDGAKKKTNEKHGVPWRSFR